MGCNCKNSMEMPQGYVSVENENENLIGKSIKYFAKFIGFLIGVALTPIIMLVIIWFMFDTIVLNKDIDLRKVVNKFVKANNFIFKEGDEYDDDDDDDDVFEELTEDDVVLVNVEDITQKTK